MRVVLYGLNFKPELTGIGKYVGELADWLGTRGVSVTVVCAQPYYPNWKEFDGYRASSYTRSEVGGVTVYRCPVWIPTRVSGLTRIFHLLSFALSSLPVILWCLSKRPNVVFLTVPSLFCAVSTFLLSKIFFVKSWVHVQDYEIDAAFDLGMLKGQSLRRFALSVERSLLRSFDRFSTISWRMFQLGLSKGIDESRAVLFPNWVDLGAIDSGGEGRGRYREELNIPSGAVVALYSGNMGAKQGLEILSQAATKLVDIPDVYFVFCGNGAGRADLERQCVGLSNVRFLDLQPMERLGELLRTADIHLLPQRADAADLVMPSKLTGMLASGRCIVATAHAGTEVAMVVEGKGLVVPPEDSAAFSEAIRSLSKDAPRRDALGRCGRLYAEQHLDKEAVLLSFEAELLTLVKSS